MTFRSTKEHLAFKYQMLKAIIEGMNAAAERIYIAVTPEVTLTNPVLVPYAKDAKGDPKPFPLNITPGAVVDFYLDEEALSFNARFNAVAHSIKVPLNAIIGIYSPDRPNDFNANFSWWRGDGSDNAGDSNVVNMNKKPTLSVVK